MARLGRYTLLEPIGEGGMAQVFRARLDGPMGFKKTLAIKRIRDSVVRQDEEHVRSLINEARIGGELRHPNIVEVYDLSEDNGIYYIAMEFVEGVTLAEMLSAAREHRARLPTSVVLEITIQICKGLAYAHGKQSEGAEPLDLVHRDLKPSNVMLTLGGQAKVMDFGIAKASSNLFATTATGIAKGTPLYMSPEQLRGVRPLKPCSDLFSVGVLLYEMTTGKLLFAGRTIPEIITRVLNQPLDDVIEEADGRIPGLGPVLKRLLDRDAAARYQDANEVRVELQRLLDWQDKEISLAEVVQAVKKGGFPGAVKVSATDAALLPIVERDDASATARSAVGDPQHVVAGAADTMVGTWLRRQRRRRLLVALLLGVLLGIGGAIASYVFRGTLGVTLRIDSAQAALNAGDLEEALTLWEQALRENPGREDARFGTVTLRSWAGEDIGTITRSLEFAPEDTPAGFARKYLAFGRVLRRQGDYAASSRNLKIALGSARRERNGAGTPVPPALLQEAAEVALVLGSPAASRGFLDELTAGQAPGVLLDLATAWIEAIAEGRAGLLAAELLYIDGHTSRAWELLADAWTPATGSKERLQGDRIVWAYRALAEGRYAECLTLVEALGPLPGERALRRAALVAQAGALAGLGQGPAARRELAAALKLADTTTQTGAAHLQAARGALAGGDHEWAASLLHEAALRFGEDDPDVRFLLALRGGASPPPEAERFQSAARLAVEPRSGRFLPWSLTREGPSGAALLAPSTFPDENRSRDGLAAPFGATFHPIDDTLLNWVYHPGR